MKNLSINPSTVVNIELNNTSIFSNPTSGKAIFEVSDLNTSVLRFNSFYIDKVNFVPFSEIPTSPLTLVVLYPHTSHLKHDIIFSLK